MKLNLDQNILAFDGVTTLDTAPNDKTPVTYRKVIEMALNLESSQVPLTAEQKLKAFQIGLKINIKKLKEYDLTTDQLAFIKERLGIFFGPIVYGRFLELIGDQAVKPPEE